MNTPNPPAPLAPDLRSRWLLRPEVTFLNHGSFGATPQCVLDEQDHWRRRIEAEPVELLSRRRPELIDVAKKSVGEFLGMNIEDFGFVTNATEGINAVLRSLPFSAGDELLTTNHVYNAVRQAMRYVCRRTDATYREIDVPIPVSSASQVAQRILSQLGPRTRLLVLDHVTSPTGLVFPVEAVVAECNARGIDVLLDGAHAPGMLPLHVPDSGAAYYAGNLHKWCGAPKGTGFLWVRPDRQSPIHPLVISHHLDEGFAHEFGWQGTRDWAACLAVPRGLAFFAQLGWDRVRTHNHQMATWAQGLLSRQWGTEPISPLDGSLLGSLAAVPLPPPLHRMNDAQGQALQQRLYSEFRIEVPLMHWCGRWLLRVSCQVYNVPEDYERVVAVIGELAGR